MIKKFADELKQARINKNISLQQIFSKTRIDIKYLEAIENGDFEILPDVYLRAFLKTYASAVDLDQDVVMKKFEAARAGKDFEERSRQEPLQSRKEIRTQENKQVKNQSYIPSEPESTIENENTGKSKNNLNIIIGAAAILIIAAVAIYFLFFRNSASTIVAEKPFDEYVEQNKQRFEDTTAKKPAPVQTQTPVVADSLILQLKAHGRSWVKVTSDGKRTIEYNLNSDQEKIIKAKKNFSLTIGNSGVVDLSFNNKPLTFSGKSGEVRSLRIDSVGTISNIYSPKQTKKPE
ncbi:MAG: helix-turn-helix domain-containing protein [Methanococcaceae archaeon]